LKFWAATITLINRFGTDYLKSLKKSGADNDKFLISND
jgi:hypothetical protein